MKKISRLMPLALLLSAAVVCAYAAGGDASDPLASLSYLTGAFTSKVDAQVTERLDASDAGLLAGVEDGSAFTAAASAATWTECRLKQGDVLSGVTGTSVMVLAGSVQVTFPAGAVIDVSAGAAVASGTTLKTNHRYLVAEDASAAFTVMSKTAVVDYQGGYSFAYSDAADYNAMAAALKTLHLFKGSFTGYGEGYDLEVAPTRMQALIMFIRVLGEEDAALAWTGATPFTDVTPGSQSASYVGYAYEKGYTNGYSATLFKPAQTVNAYQYTEFILRALGYSSTANTNLADTLTRAADSGVLTAGEVSMLQKDPFLRAELAYVSYYALDAQVAGAGQTLAAALQAKGVFTEDELSAAKAMVGSWRK